jgi:hypothetical protein
MSQLSERGIVANAMFAQVRPTYFWESVIKIKDVYYYYIICMLVSYPLASVGVNTSGKAGAQIPHLPLGDESSLRGG